VIPSVEILNPYLKIWLGVDIQHVLTKLVRNGLLLKKREQKRQNHEVGC